MLTAAALPLGAQSVRINGTTTARYIDMKPIGGTERLSLMPLTQDLSLNAWGFGQGLRIYAEARVRGSAGDEAAENIWPQATDNFDLLAAFAELDRPSFRVRAGRQYKASSLGLYNYDGASLLIRPMRVLRAEIFGGWALVPGESDDYASSVLGAIEPYAPDVRRNLLGSEVQLHFGQRFNVSGLYQREIRTDRAALHSERAAANAVLRLPRFTVDAALQADLAGDVVNQARLRLSAPLVARITGGVEARRYRPYFELWTIWGAFNPIGFEEVIASTRWSSTSGSLALHLGGGLRRYHDDDGGVQFDRLRDDGWRVEADASWTPRPAVTFSGGYRADIGFGASRSQGDVTARLNFGDNWISASGLAFQTVNELQIRDGTVLGAGTDASFKLNDASKVGWSFAVYRHDNVNPVDEIDWNQVRATVWLEWTVGSNPDVKRVAAQRSK